VPPRGPPPSFATREEWISSLPSWRRNKPRRIWEQDSIHFQDTHQGFEEGLAVADNAAVIKGAPVQACIPPVSTLIASADYASPSRSTDMYTAFHEDLDDDMSTYSARVHGWHCESGRSSEVSPITNADYGEIDVERTSQGYDSYDNTPGSYRECSSGRLYSAEAYERGSFSPVFEDMSPEPVPGHDPGSSPIGPATPFAEFVDKAVAQIVPGYDHSRPTDTAHEVQYTYQDRCYGAQCHQCQAYSEADQAMSVPAPEPVITPTATAAYKKLAEPISEWIASYVWKACTTGMSLPTAYAQPMAFIKHYPSSPPSHLANSTHSMLLSTLLQPSAIFLAVWYIVRLPVFFGPVNFDHEHHRKEIRFRAELLGEAHLGFDRDTFETYAPFRLILLGCMLANKWLDDHTFSNKTWHTISNVPIQNLNKLESLALDIFRYDLSVSTHEWTDWLSHLLSYHSSLNSHSCPQPISRPSTNPHTIVRRAIENLIEVGVGTSACHCCDEDQYTAGPPVPVFVGIEERRKDGRDPGHAYDDDALEIDLDEDGPLREEYLPRRRISGAGSLRRSQLRQLDVDSDRSLPPPAKWSPAADEPIIRNGVRASMQYVAPQPISYVPMAPPLPPSLAFHRILESQQSVWGFAGYMPKQEPVVISEPVATAYHVQPSYSAYESGYPIAPTHSRSHSLSYNQAIAGHAHGRLRSYSQTGFDHGYSDLRLSENSFVPPPPVMSRWSPADAPIYPPPYDRPFECHQRSLKV